MDFELARFNMIEQQIRPWDVLDPAVLAALNSVHRENFVAPSLRHLALSDCELPIYTTGAAEGTNSAQGHSAQTQSGETMLSPKVEARLAQNLKLQKTERVLEIGTGSGHMAALLAQLAHQVVSVEINPALVSFAQHNLQQQGIPNVQVQAGCGFALAASLAKSHGPFDAIVLSGACPVVPEALLQALSPHGRLLAVVGKAPIMQAVLVQQSGAGQAAQTPLFETMAPYLQNAPQAQAFVF